MFMTAHLTKKSIFPVLLLLTVGCNRHEKQENNEQSSTPMEYSKGTFGYDLEFLKRYHQDLVLLHDSVEGAQLIVLPGYQGRVMTSTARGLAGNSFGWINYDLIASQAPAKHIHAFGGEERFWLGPEGGQFSIYFKKGDPFTFEHWQVPAEIDTEPFVVAGATADEVQLTKEMHLENYFGTKLNLMVNRNIRLLSRKGVEELLDIVVPNNIETVGFQSENIITNTGTERWTKKTGMLSVWILSMLNASNETTVAIPFRDGDEKLLGKIVTDDYFGKVPADRLAIGDHVILFKADGKYRSKIGLSPKRALPIVGSFDALNEVLTIATFSLPEGATDYVNSLWELQNDPFRGDAINSYNDGPVNGGQMGNLYEIESSSPAAALAPGEHLTHYHRTIHLKGPKESLNVISQKVLGVGVDEIRL
jgi:hypothetical protein